MYKILLIFLFVSSSRAFLTCESSGPGYFKFLSKTASIINLDVNTASLAGRCFHELFFTLRETDSKFEVSLKAQKKSSYFCLEFIVLSSGKNSKWDLFLLPQKQHVFKFDKALMSDFEQNYIRKKGLRIMLSCDSSSNWLSDIFMTARIFLEKREDKEVSKKIEKLSLDLIKTMTDYEYKLRENNVLKLKKESIKSGDFFAMLRMDGLFSIINLGSGSRVGHSTVAMWRDGELYVCESEDGVYFTKHGIQCNPYEYWFDKVVKAGFNVVVLPLKKEMRDKFDEEKAWAFIDSMVGLNYGFQNFLFGFYDTVDKNLPSVLDLNFLSFLMSKLDYFIHDQLDLIFYQGFNKRLGTENLKLEEIWEELYKRDMSFEEMMALVENDDWVYSGGHSYVCSAFVTAVYKKAGLFGDFNIQATEFTPKDLYELNFYDVSGNSVPEECKDFAPHGYCQLSGKYDLNLGKVSFVDPYNNMAEKCPSLIPDFQREDNC